MAGESGGDGGGWKRKRRDRERGSRRIKSEIGEGEVDKIEGGRPESMTVKEVVRRKRDEIERRSRRSKSEIEKGEMTRSMEGGGRREEGGGRREGDRN